MLSPLLSLWGLPPPPQGACSCSLLASANEVRFYLLTPHFVCSTLRLCTVRVSLSSFTVSAELSTPFTKYLSVSATWSCQGTLWLVTSASRLRFAFGKASAAVTLVGSLKRLNCLPLPILPPLPSLSSSRCSVTATPLPLSPPRQLAPYCSLFRGRSSIAI